MITLADIHLVPEYDPFTRTVVVDVVLVSEEPVRIVVADFAFEWDARELILLDCHDDRATVPNLIAGFPPPQWDFYGANESLPPQDGNGWATWLSPLNGIPVIMEKAVLFSFVFQVQGDKGLLSIVPEIEESYPLRTVIYGTDIPGLQITGSLDHCVIRRRGAHER